MTTETEVQTDTEPTPDHSEQSQDLTHHEARKYRKRAQAAEKLLADAQRELDEKSSKLTELEETVTALERQSRIDELLLEADAMDLESARLLTEMAVAQMDQPDIDAAVAELKRRKPYLFRQASRSGVGTTALAPKFDDRASQQERAVHAAAEASASGSRTDLLRYLRLRRRKR